MRPRSAYISSLGTTAILVAAALLMLAVVGAIVAFRGWPGGEAGASVQSVPLAPPTASAQVALVRPVTRAPTAVERLTRAAIPAATRKLSTVGLVKQVSSSRAGPGLVLVPANGSPMRGSAPPPGGPNVPPSGPAGPLPDPPSGGPLPPAGGGFDPALPVPIPGSPPSGSQLTGALGQLVARVPPPPGVAAIITRLHD
jgi:hypothetical protein